MSKVKKIFEFLKEFDQISNPVITNYKKQLWDLNLNEFPKIEEIKSIYDNNEENIFLEVTKPVFDKAPKPDESFKRWIKAGWTDFSITENLIKSYVFVTTEENNVTVQKKLFLTDCKEENDLINQWLIARENWRQAQLEKDKCLLIYNKLYNAYSMIKKDAGAIELVLGNGIITWNIDGLRLNHPVLLQNVQLEFFPEYPKFVVSCDEIKASLYTPMLRIIPSLNQKMLTDLVAEINSNEYIINDFNQTKRLYERIINIIDNKGSFVEEYNKQEKNAQIYSMPILFLRKRTLGYDSFIDGIINEVSTMNDTDLPAFLNNMVGNYQKTKKIKSSNNELLEGGVDKDVLLTLPANNDQLKIIKYLDNYGAVLVQGPPGTGKTHTIANLIGHLLSEGNNVLVTSQTEKALSVLKEKVYCDEEDPEINLQNLCISILSSKSQKKEMDNVIFEIAEKSTAMDPDETEDKIKNLKKVRSNLVDTLQHKVMDVAKIRGLEYTDIVYNNEVIKPIDAAKFVKSGVSTIDYINGKTSDPTLGFPLDEEELLYIYSSNKSLSVEDEDILTAELPQIDLMIAPSDFKQLVTDLNAWEKRKPLEDVLEISSDCDANNLKDYLEKANKFQEDTSKLTELEKKVINKSMIDNVWIEYSYEIKAMHDKLVHTYEDIKRITLKNHYEYDLNLCTKENIKILNKIIKTNKENPFTGLGMVFKSDWKELRSKLKKEGEPISTLNEVIDYKNIFEFIINKNELIKKIKYLFADIEYDYQSEDILFEYDSCKKANRLINLLKWNDDDWYGYHDDIMDAFVDCDETEELFDLDDYTTVDKILAFNENIVIANLNFQIDKNKHLEDLNKYNTYQDYLIDFKLTNNILDSLIENVSLKNVKSYKKCYENLYDTILKNEVFCKRNTILTKIKKVCPSWAAEIKNRVGVHGECTPPASIRDAWKWRQLFNQLEKYDKYNINLVCEEIKQLHKSITKNAQELAYLQAWYHQIINRTPQQLQALEGWRTTMRQIGKGTGKRAPALKKKAKELMPQCQSAIPVWIMPVNRVVDYFDPTKNKFDVIIIDEASQSDILSLAVLALGKKIIIVGDDEQVSPDCVGIKKDDVDALIDLYLEDIPNNHLFNSNTSLYDMAKSSGFKPLMLSEHFRCLPEIIGFSNSLSYNGRIKAMRDSNTVNITKPVVEYRVPNGFRDNKRNLEEALHIASLICAAIEFNRYKEYSFGVISLLGEEQSLLIDRLLQKHLDPVLYEKHNIQCGTPPQFQGDERDIIFLSVVEAPSTEGGPVRLVTEEGRNEMMRKRYNVAASRAKNQMWVVHSLNCEIDLKPDDIRFRLIKFAQNPEIANHSEQLKLAESPFEEEVMTYLANQGFIIKPQVKVGSYRIDMVIEDGTNRIALELDGERWHTDLKADMKRQAILERLGWTFIRIRGSEYYRDKEATLAKLKDKLATYNINPNYKNYVEPNPEVDHQSERIIRRAAKIRDKWTKETLIAQS